MNDPRIGIKSADRVVFPTLTISGNTVKRPATTLDLDQTHFIVLDEGQRINEQDWLEVNAILVDAIGSEDDVAFGFIDSGANGNG